MSLRTHFSPENKRRKTNHNFVFNFAKQNVEKSCLLSYFHKSFIAKVKVLCCKNSHLPFSGKSTHRQYMYVYAANTICYRRAITVYCIFLRLVLDLTHIWSLWANITTFLATENIFMVYFFYFT